MAQGRAKREVGQPGNNGVITFTRKVETQSNVSLVETEIYPYTNNGGGYGGFSPEMTVTTNSVSDGLEITFEIDTDTAQAGSDHIIKYVIENPNGSKSRFTFFYQNGLKDLSKIGTTNGSLVARISADLQHSQSSEKGQDINKVINYGTGGDFTTIDGTVNLNKNNQRTRYGGENVPYFSFETKSTTLRGVSNLLSTVNNSFTVFGLIEDNSSQATNRSLVKIDQGSDNISQLKVNLGNSIFSKLVDPDEIFVTSSVYTTSNRLKKYPYLYYNTYNDPGGNINAGINGICNGNYNLTGNVGSGEFSIRIGDPSKDGGDSLKIYEILVFDEAIGSREKTDPSSRTLNEYRKVSKHLSYLYNFNFQQDFFEPSGQNQPNVGNNLEDFPALKTADFLPPRATRSIRNHTFYVSREQHPVFLSEAALVKKKFDQSLNEIKEFSSAPDAFDDDGYAGELALKGDLSLFNNGKTVSAIAENSEDNSFDDEADGERDIHIFDTDRNDDPQADVINGFIIFEAENFFGGGALRPSRTTAGPKSLTYAYISNSSRRLVVLTPQIAVTSVRPTGGFPDSDLEDMKANDSGDVFLAFETSMFKFNRSLELQWQIDLSSTAPQRKAIGLKKSNEGGGGFIGYSENSSNTTKVYEFGSDGSIGNEIITLENDATKPMRRIALSEERICISTPQKVEVLERGSYNKIWSKSSSSGDILAADVDPRNNVFVLRKNKMTKYDSNGNQLTTNEIINLFIDGAEGDVGNLLQVAPGVYASQWV